MSDLANEQACPCPACTPRPDVASQPGEALAALRRRWAAQDSPVRLTREASICPPTPSEAVTGQPRASQGHLSTNAKRVSRRHWLHWLRVPHLHHEGDAR